MLGNVLFWSGLIVALTIGFVYFRDLGDLSQLFLRVARVNMHRFIRNEYQLLAVGIGATLLMVVAYLLMDGGPPWVFWTALVVLATLYIYTWGWVHIVMRNQKNSAKYYSIEEAKTLLAPSSRMIVIEQDDVVHAYPHSEIMRPHLVGNDEQIINDERVLMTYCTVANVPIAYTPEIEGEPVDLVVMGQFGNNLVLRDNNTGEPIQHMYGYRERDGKNGPAMKTWPIFRMSFRGFQKAYPEGTVFLNKPSANPVLRQLDKGTQYLFAAAIAQQHDEEKPLFENMTHCDNRLPNKSYVWGIDISGDAVCYTDDFIIENDGLINATIGGRDIVVYYDPKYESVGAYYNDSGAPIQEIDFFGHCEQGQLKRVETLKPGLFWHVWVEFFQHTDINRIGSPANTDAPIRETT